MLLPLLYWAGCAESYIHIIHSQLLCCVLCAVEKKVLEEKKIRQSEEDVKRQQTETPRKPVLRTTVHGAYSSRFGILLFWPIFFMQKKRSYTNRFFYCFFFVVFTWDVFMFPLPLAAATCTLPGTCYYSMCLCVFSRHMLRCTARARVMVYFEV